MPVISNIFCLVNQLQASIASRKESDKRESTGDGSQKVTLFKSVFRIKYQPTPPGGVRGIQYPGRGTIENATTGAQTAFHPVSDLIR